MRRTMAILTLVSVLVAGAVAMEFTFGLTVGLPAMSYLSGQLEAMAAREGLAASGVSPAWGGHTALWPWHHLGIGLEFLTASGGISGREFTPQTCWAIGLTLQGRLILPFFGRPVSLTAEVGAYRAQASGLISGGGWGLGGRLSAGGPLFSWGWGELTWEAGFRYLPVAAIQGEGGRIEPATLPALDFSGFYLGVDFAWGG